MGWMNEEQLERELTGEPIGKFATGSLLLHLGLIAGTAAYLVLHSLMPHNNWGGSTVGSAVTARMTSSIPLPSDQPPNENVLATEKPSPAPAPPEPKAAPRVDDDALAISGKQAKPKQQQAIKTPKAQKPTPNNRAQYGEQAANNIPRAVQGQTNINGPVSVNQGDFGTRFAYYIANIQRKMQANSNMLAVDPRTAKGSRAYVLFTIHRDGTLSSISLDRASGSATLDRECLRAAQRVDSFGPLPAGYSGTTVLTSYYCEY